MTGGTVLGTGTTYGGTAMLFSDSLPTGASEITAVYGGDANRSGSTSKKLRQVVKKVATTTTLSSMPNPSISGQTVFLMAVVSAGFEGPADGGTVTFMTGQTVLGTAPFAPPYATISVTLVKVGITPIWAVYGDSPYYANSTSNVVKQVVEKAGNQ
jgi:hypothetical protein